MKLHLTKLESLQIAASFEEDAAGSLGEPIWVSYDFETLLGSKLGAEAISLANAIVAEGYVSPKSSSLAVAMNLMNTSPVSLITFELTRA